MCTLLRNVLLNNSIYGDHIIPMWFLNKSCSHIQQNINHRCWEIHSFTISALWVGKKVHRNFTSLCWPLRKSCKNCIFALFLHYVRMSKSKLTTWHIQWFRNKIILLSGSRRKLGSNEKGNMTSLKTNDQAHWEDMLSSTLPQTLSLIGFHCAEALRAMYVLPLRSLTRMTIFSKPQDSKNLKNLLKILQILFGAIKNEGILSFSLPNSTWERDSTGGLPIINL